MTSLIQPLPGDHDRALVFGLRWASSISANPEQEARRIARQARAAYYTRARARSTVVGMLILDRRDARPGRKTALYSAAAAFARAHERGTVALRLALSDAPDAPIWVTAAKDGMVLVGADNLYTAAADAQRYLDQLRHAHPDLQMFGNRDGDTMPADGFLRDNLTDSTQLRPAAFTLPDISTGTWLLLGAIVLLAAWQFASQWHAQRQRDRDDASRKAEPVDPVAAWQHALAQWEQSQRMHGMPGLHAMFETAASIPIAPGRWELTEIDCHPAQCTAAYRRTRLADNPSLRQALDPDIAIQFTALDAATIRLPIRWQPDTTGVIAQMPTQQALQQDLYALWQRLRPALDDLRLGQRTPAVITAPLAPNSDGSPAPLAFPAHAGLPYPHTQEFVINAPLRSMPYVALPAQSQILQLHIRPFDAREPDLQRSALHATLKGILYVQ